FVSDDVVFLEDRGGRVRVLGFPDALGVSEATAGWFEELRGMLTAAPRDGFPKRLVRVEGAFAGQPLAGCEPQLLVFPEVRPGGDSTVHPLDPREAWLRLVPDVLLTQPAGTQSHLQALSALLASVRCYRLESGSDLRRTAEIVIGLI